VVGNEGCEGVQGYNSTTDSLPEVDEDEDVVLDVKSAPNVKSEPNQSGRDIGS
jgi:hypothetical protein